MEARRHGEVEQMRLQGQALSATREEAWDNDGGDSDVGRGEHGKLFGDLGLAVARVMAYRIRSKTLTTAVVK